MQRPPPLSQAPHFPVTTITSLAAIGVTLAYWNHWDISALVMSPEAAGREPWRLVTSALPHVSLPHLFFNLYWFWIFGTLLEKAFGPLRFLGLVVLLAAASSAAEYALFEGGVGLSGVGYGLFGMLWALRRREGFESVIDQRTISMFVIWFFACIVTTWIGIMNVGNVAHGTGAALGYLIGMCVASKERRGVLSGAVVACLVTIGVGVTVCRPVINLARFSTRGRLVHAYQALKDGKNQEAADLFEPVVQAGTSDAAVLYNYGVALQRLDRTSEAFNSYLEAARLDPKPLYRKAVGQYGAYLASLEIDEHDPDDARGIIKRAMEVEPNDSRLWLWSGVERRESGDEAGAAAAFEKALALDPTNADASKQLENLRTRER